MIPVELATIANVVHGELIGINHTINSIMIDSRKLNHQGLFIAIVGNNFDGHNFCLDAISQGAIGVLIAADKLALVQDQIANITDVSLLIVQDPKIALGKIAAYIHQKLRLDLDIPTVAITGSCGKTTVKEMVRSILLETAPVLATYGNLNNELGVPLTLIERTAKDRFAILELGANHIGEIAYTTSLVKPHIALVNNVAPAHIEGFGTLMGVARAKGEIYEGLAAGDIALVNYDNYITDAAGDEHWVGGLWQDILADKKIVTFSYNNNNADYFASNCKLTTDGKAHFTLNIKKKDISFDLKLNIVGKHNIINAVAAAAIADLLGSSKDKIKQGLLSLTKVQSRSDTIKLNDNITLIDDSYNASVPAVKAAIDLLSIFAHKQWLILGDMAELGDKTIELHREIGLHAAKQNFAYVLTYGDDTKVISDICAATKAQAKHFSSHQDMIDFIKVNLASDGYKKHTILVKGSHSSGMLKVALAIKELF